MDKVKSKDSNHKFYSPYGKSIGGKIETEFAYIYLKKHNRCLAKLTISNITSLEENKMFTAEIINRYIQYVKGGQGMEIVTSKKLDVRISNGMADIIDIRSQQVIGKLRFSPQMPALETMAFINNVVMDYEKYLKLIDKRFHC